MPSGTCALCGDVVSSRGEHVLPNWLLNRFDNQGRFSVYSGGKLVRTRKGAADREKLARVTLPMCGEGSSNNCNEWLNQEFESSGKAAVEAALEWRPLSGAQVQDFGRWCVKTMLLYVHPDAVLSQDRQLRSDHSSFGGARQLARDIRTNSRIPPDVSVFAGAFDYSAPSNLVTSDVVEIPQRTTRADGAGGASFATTLGIGSGLQDKRGIVLHLVIHPAMDFDHPWEANGRLTRIWPDPPAAIDLASMVSLSESEVAAVASSIVSVGLMFALPDGKRWSIQSESDTLG